MATRRLTVGQRALLLVYCTDHAIAACKGCGQAITLADLFAHLWTVHPSTYECPHCGSNVADSIHQHLSSCPFIGEAASNRTRQIVAEVHETLVVPDADGEARRELAARSTESGLIRCAICRRGLSAASDIIIREGHLMHPACAETQAVTTARRPA